MAELLVMIREGVGAYDVLVDGYFSNEVTFTPDGRGLVFRYGNAAAGMDIGFKDLSTDTVNPELLATEFSEKAMVLSPDGRWLAYVSNAGGQDEVFVRPFPDVASGLWTVSRGGGTEPLWSPAGGELFYRRGDGWMVATTYEADSTFAVLGREALFDAGRFRAAANHRDYDVSSSGERFIMLAPYESGASTPDVILVQNWFTELEEVLGRGR
jgi:hypothetical protein